MYKTTPDAPAGTSTIRTGKRPARLNKWHIASGALALLVAVPLLVVFSGWLQPVTEVWSHLAETLLSQLFINTIKLVIGVGLGVMLLGVSLAWLTARCEFPGRRLFDWMLMLPLADFGTVATFNYDTFTTAIYKAWFGFFSLQAASQLASLLLPRPLSWATGLVSCMKATCCSGTRPLIFTTNRMIVLLPILSARAAFFVGNSLLLMP